MPMIVDSRVFLALRDQAMRLCPAPFTPELTGDVGPPFQRADGRTREKTNFGIMCYWTLSPPPPPPSSSSPAPPLLSPAPTFPIEAQGRIWRYRSSHFSTIWVTRGWLRRRELFCMAASMPPSVTQQRKSKGRGDRSNVAHLLRGQEVDVQQLPLAVHQRQESDGDVVVGVEVGAGAAVVVAVVLHGHQGREVAPRVAQGDGALPAEALLPQQRQTMIGLRRMCARTKMWVCSRLAPG
ncbi:hypothetical protein EYF80_015845 [Liparis tanakae]|uniref:Uncharacterized protein n=1 Tax=Liparis tanakae TaxID=230148 RepID=A0A4Z2I7A2_9TELE|nr:hypothetical protein EYF80_015845 [Liparis tanakae]